MKNKSGISLIAVMMFMLAATSASIVLFKWVGSENFASGARLKQSEAWQASESGLDAVQAWLTNNAADVGDLVTKYNSQKIKKNFLLANTGSVLGSSIGGNQNRLYRVYLTAVDTKTKPMMLKFMSVGYGRDNSTVSQTAVFSVNGLYTVSVRAEHNPCEATENRPDWCNFNQAFYGLSENNTQTEFSSAIINGNLNWSNGITTKGGLIVTGDVNGDMLNENVYCGDIENEGDLYVTGDLNVTRLNVCGNVYVGGATGGNKASGNAWNVTGSYYAKGGFGVGEKRFPDINIGTNLTAEGNIDMSQMTNKNLTVSGNMVMKNGAKINVDVVNDRKLNVNGSVWSMGEIFVLGKKSTCGDWGNYIEITEEDRNDIDAYGKLNLGTNGKLMIPQNEALYNCEGKTQYNCNNDNTRWYFGKSGSYRVTLKIPDTHQYACAHNGVECVPIKQESWGFNQLWDCNNVNNIVCSGTNSTNCLLRDNGYSATITSSDLKPIRFSGPAGEGNYVTPSVSNEPAGADQLDKLASKIKNGKVPPPLQLNPSIKEEWMAKANALLARANDAGSCNTANNEPAGNLLPASCVYLFRNSGNGCNDNNFYSKSTMSGSTFGGGRFYDYLSQCYSDLLSTPACQNNTDCLLYGGSGAGSEKFLPIILKSHNPDGFKDIIGNFILIFEEKPGILKLPRTPNGSKVLLYLQEGADGIALERDGGERNYFIFSDGNIGSATGGSDINGTIFMNNDTKIGSIYDSNIKFNEDLYRSLVEAGILETNPELGSGEDNPGDENLRDALTDTFEGEETVDRWIPVGNRLNVNLESKQISKESIPISNPEDLKPSILIMPRVVRIATDEFEGCATQNCLRDYYTFMALNGAKLGDTAKTAPVCARTSGIGNLNITGNNSNGNYECTFSGTTVNHSNFYVIVSEPKDGVQASLDPNGIKTTNGDCVDVAITVNEANQSGGYKVPLYQTDEGSTSGADWRKTIVQEDGTDNCVSGDNNTWTCTIPEGALRVNALKVCPPDGWDNPNRETDPSIGFRILPCTQGSCGVVNDNLTIGISFERVPVNRNEQTESGWRFCPFTANGVWAELLNCNNAIIDAPNNSWRCNKNSTGVTWKPTEENIPEGCKIHAGYTQVTPQDLNGSNSASFQASLEWKKATLSISGGVGKVRLRARELTEKLSEGERDFECNNGSCDIYQGIRYEVSSPNNDSYIWSCSNTITCENITDAAYNNVLIATPGTNHFVKAFDNGTINLSQPEEPAICDGGNGVFWNFSDQMFVEKFPLDHQGKEHEIKSTEIVENLSIIPGTGDGIINYNSNNNFIAGQLFTRRIVLNRTDEVLKFNVDGPRQIGVYIQAGSGDLPSNGGLPRNFVLSNGQDTLMAGIWVGDKHVFNYEGGAATLSLSPVQLSNEGVGVSIYGIEACEAVEKPSSSSSSNDCWFTGDCPVAEVCKSGGAETKFWNFSEGGFTSLPTGIGAIAENYIIDGLGILAYSSPEDKTLSYGDDNKSIDGINFTKSIDLRGMGSVPNKNRAFNFNIGGKGKITVYAMNPHVDQIRPIVVHNGTSELNRTNLPNNAIFANVYNYTGASSPIYIYSGSSGIKVYGIKVECEPDYPDFCWYSGNNCTAGAGRHDIKEPGTYDLIEGCPPDKPILDIWDERFSSAGYTVKVNGYELMKNSAGGMRSKCISIPSKIEVIFDNSGNKYVRFDCAAENVGGITDEHFCCFTDDCSN